MIANAASLPVMNDGHRYCPCCGFDAMDYEIADVPTILANKWKLKCNCTNGELCGKHGDYDGMRCRTHCGCANPD